MTPTPEREREAERRAVVAWLRKTVGMEVAQMILVAGLPGGTRTQRVKNAAYADGCAHAVKMIADCIESGDHIGDER